MELDQFEDDDLIQKIEQAKRVIAELEEEKILVNEEIRNKRKRIENEYIIKKQKVDDLKAEVQSLKQKNLALDATVQKVLCIIFNLYSVR